MSPRARPAPRLRWGLGGLVVLLLALGLIFGLRPPSLHPPFHLHAFVASDSSVRPGQPVRIAGVDVGRVTDVQPGPRGSRSAFVSLDIDRGGLPLHTDTRGRIRPRLLLEGNFFVDLQPGSPERPLLHSGETLAAGAITGPVQLDRVLSDLPLSTRTSLRGFLQGYGAAIGTAGRSSETGGQSLHRALRDSPAALRDTAVVTRASLGTAPDDFSHGVGGTGRFLAGLAADDQQLGDLVQNFDRTVRALSDRAPELRRTIVALDGVTRRAGPSFRALDGALPPLRALARRLLPGTRRLAGTIAVTDPWLEQTAGLLTEPELGGLARDLQAVVANTASANRGLRELTRQTDAVDRCLLGRILPIGNRRVSDPPLSTHIPVYLEALQAFTGLAGAAGGFDGNGSFLRGQAGGGTVPVRTSALPSQGPLFGNAAVRPLGTRPRSLGVLPPVRTGARCGTTPRPDLRATTGGGP